MFMIFRGFSGMGWGRGQPYGQGALGENPRKSLWGRGGEGGPSRARGFFGENPRKKLYFGAGTKVEFSGIFPSLLESQFLISKIKPKPKNFKRENVSFFFIMGETQNGS